MSINHDIPNPTLDQAREKLIEVFTDQLFDKNVTGSGSPLNKLFTKAIFNYVYARGQIDKKDDFYKQVIAIEIIDYYKDKKEIDTVVTALIGKKDFKKKLFEKLAKDEAGFDGDEMDQKLALVINNELVRDNPFDPKEERKNYENALMDHTQRVILNYARKLSYSVCDNNQYEETMVNWVYRHIHALAENEKKTSERANSNIWDFVGKIQTRIKEARKLIELDAKEKSSMPDKNQTKPVIPASTQTIIIKEAPPPPPPRRRYRQ